MKLNPRMRTSLFAYAITATLLVPMLSGCSTLYGDYSTKSITFSKDNEIAKILENINKNTTKSNEAQYTFTSCEVVSSNATCQLNRNRVLALLVASSDKICNDHLKTIYGNEASSNILLGSLATVFTAASAGMSATAIAAKTNYAVAGTISSAERSLINDVVYKTILVPVIHQKILSIRQTKRQSLEFIYLQEYTAYPIERAVSDVVSYHYSCSFMEGLQKALQEGSSDTSVIRLRATVADASNQLSAAKDSLNTEDKDSLIKDPTTVKNPVFAQALIRFNAYSAALQNAEIAAAGVKAAPSPEKTASETTPPTAPKPKSNASAPAPANPSSATK